MKKDTLDIPFQEDIRGTIHRYNLHWKKINLLFTKAWYYRWWEVHPYVQYVLVLKGSVEFIFRKDAVDLVQTYWKNEIVKIEAYIPHLFKSLVDSLIMEWRDGDFEVEYYPPYRNLVLSQFTHG